MARLRERITADLLRRLQAGAPVEAGSLRVDLVQETRLEVY